MPRLDPTSERDRIGALDAVRGFALLGILFVNMRFFAMPVGFYEQWAPAENATTLDALAHWFIKIFCESKFYPLYSMLFGMGLVLQRASVLERGRAFTPLYLRRLSVLFLIGLVHAFCLWYGDILLIYSVAGLILLGFAGATARRLKTVGVGLIGLTTVGVATLTLAASAMVLFDGVVLRDLGAISPGGEVVGLGMLAVPLTIFAALGVINALNMVDGVDGLAGSVALVALLAIALLALVGGAVAWAELAVLLSASVVAFLLFNWRHTGDRPSGPEF